MTQPHQRPDHLQSLTDLIRYRAAHNPDLIAVHFEEETLTFKQLLDSALQVAGALQAEGVRPGDRVVLNYPNGTAFFPAFYGIQFAGAAAAPLFPNLGAEKVAAIAQHCGAACVLLHENTKGALVADLMQALPDTPIFLGLPEEEARALPTRTAEDIAFLQYTSGSTGFPKAVMLSHGGLIRNVQQMIAGMEITEEDIFVSWLPVFHDMGLILKTMVPFYLAVPLYLLPTSLANPALWLKTIAEKRGTFTAAPDFAYRTALRYIKNPDHYDLSSLRVALNAAEPVRAETMQTFQEAFSLNHVMVAGYGLAEATVGVTMWKPKTAPIIDHRGLVSVGKAFPGVELRIQTENGAAKPGEMGDIYIRSEANCLGYLNNNNADALLFDDHGFLNSGDIGYIDNKGHLFIAGRKKNIIISGGRTIANQELEEVVDLHPQVRGSAAVGIDRGGLQGEQIFLFAEVRRGDLSWEDLSIALTALLRENLGLKPARIYLLKNHGIPKTHNGKVQHAELRRRYLNNELSEKILFPNY